MKNASISARRATRFSAPLGCFFFAYKHLCTRWIFFFIYASCSSAGHNESWNAARWWHSNETFEHILSKEERNIHVMNAVHGRGGPLFDQPSVPIWRMSHGLLGSERHARMDSSIRTASGTQCLIHPHPLFPTTINKREKRRKYNVNTVLCLPSILLLLHPFCSERPHTSVYCITPSRRPQTSSLSVSQPKKQKTAQLLHLCL